MDAVTRQLIFDNLMNAEDDAVSGHAGRCEANGATFTLRDSTLRQADGVVPVGSRREAYTRRQAYRQQASAAWHTANHVANSVAVRSGGDDWLADA